MPELQTYVDEAKEELEEAVHSGEYSKTDLYDQVHEIADRIVPNYYWEVLDVALNDYSVALTIPENWPSGDDATPMNLMTTNIYEHISKGLYGVLSEIYAN